MSRQKKYGMTDKEINRCHLIQLIEYLSKLETKPITIKEVADGIDLIMPMSQFVANRTIRRLIDPDTHCPNGVNVIEFKKAREVARELMSRRDRPNRHSGGLRYCGVCCRAIFKMLIRRPEVLGSEMMQADIIRALRPEGFSVPVIRQALQYYIERRFFEKRMHGSRIYYRPTDYGKEFHKKLLTTVVY